MKPSTSPRRSLRCSLRRGLGALPLALLLAILVPAATTAQSLQGLRDDGTWLRVTSHRDGLHLERAAAASRALPFAAGAVANDLRQGAESFWLAAVEPASTGPRIAVLEGRGDQVKRLPELPKVTGRLLREPTLLTDTRGLRAILWLAGDTPTGQALYAARFDGRSWQDAITVASPGPGSQMALTATVLEDGSWLAAWAAFDGQDTEILWSRAVDGRWSTPSAVARGNRVPDITPHLLAVRGGALLAWSQYDGNDYRVMMARFEEDAWQSPRTLGEPGTLYPSFQAGEIPVLVFQQVVPSAWEVIAFDEEGRIQRRGSVALHRDEPPLVERIDAQGALLGWSNSGVKAAEQVRLRWADSASVSRQ